MEISATQKSPSPLTSRNSTGLGWVVGSPLLHVLDPDEALAGLRELEDGVVVVHRVCQLGIVAGALEVLLEHRLHGPRVHARRMPDLRGLSRVSLRLDPRLQARSVDDDEAEEEPRQCRNWPDHGLTIGACPTVLNPSNMYCGLACAR